MQYKKYILIDTVLKTLIFVSAFYALLLGVCKCMYYGSDSFLIVFYSFLQAIAYICVFAALLRGKSKVFFVLGMLLLILYEWKYAFGELIYDDRFIHMIYMGSYIFLLLLSVLLNIIKDRRISLNARWMLPFGAAFGITVILYRVWFLQQAGIAMLENSHNIVIEGFQADYEHLIEEISIVLLAVWAFLSHSKDEVGETKINKLYLSEIVPAVLFFGLALDIVYMLFELLVLRVHYNDFSFSTMRYFLRMASYFVVFLLMGIALLKKKRVLLGIISAVVFIMYVVWKAVDYDGAKYYVYMLGYLTIFILNIVRWIDKKYSFRCWLYLLFPIIFLFVASFFEVNQGIVFIEDLVKDSYTMRKDLVNYFAIFFTMLCVIYPNELPEWKRGKKNLNGG